MPYEVSCSYCRHTQIYKPRNNKIPKKPHTKCKKCTKEFSIDIGTSENIPRVPNLPKQKILEKVHDQNSANFDTSIIDDPNELLMSCAMRELNKSTPDVRWGNILLTLLDKTKRLESKSKTEVMIRRKLVKYSSNQLIELRKKLIKS